MKKLSQFVGKKVEVEALDGDDFTNDFVGFCVGIHFDFLEVRDADDDVWDVLPDQVKIIED